ncbi:hypothetical protein AD951_01900, partial [Acetobacter malorum]
EEIAAFRKGFFGKLATAREEDLKEKAEEIRASESAKNDDLLLRAQRAEGSLNEARDGKAEALGQLARQEEKYNEITAELGRKYPGAAREIRELERDFDKYKAEFGGGGQAPAPEAGIQHDDDEATRNLKNAAARESAVNARNSGPSM